MFVDIESFKGAIGVENILMPYKKGRLSPDKKTRLPKEHITPDVCWQVLKSTNNPRNIKDMLQCIVDLPLDEQAKFEKVVVAVFQQREQPESVWILGRELAQNSGYLRKLDFFSEIDDGRFLLSSPNLSRGLKTPEYEAMTCEIKNCDKIIYTGRGDVPFSQVSRFAPIMEFPFADTVMFEQCNLQDLQKIKLKEGACIDFNDSLNFSQPLDLSPCDKIFVDADVDADYSKWTFNPNNLFRVFRYKDLPETVDCSEIKNVAFWACQFEDVKQIILADNARVSVLGASCLPKGIDYPKCAEIDFVRAKLPDDEQFCFKDGARVNFSFCRNFYRFADFSKCKEVALRGLNRPEISFIKHVRRADEKNRNKLKQEPNLPDNLDFSSCDVLDLGCCNLINQPHLRFKDGAKVNLDLTVNLPQNIDFSTCAEVSLCAADLEGVKELHFREGAKVKLDGAVNLPAQLDFSKCDEVSLRNGAVFFDDVKKLVFKNKEQFIRSGCILLEDWKGEIVFADGGDTDDTRRNLAVLKSMHQMNER